MLLLLSPFMATTVSFSHFVIKVKLEILKKLTSSAIIYTSTPISSHTKLAFSRNLGLSILPIMTVCTRNRWCFNRPVTLKNVNFFNFFWSGPNIYTQMHSKVSVAGGGGNKSTAYCTVINYSLNPKLKISFDCMLSC